MQAIVAAMTQVPLAIRYFTGHKVVYIYVGGKTFGAAIIELWTTNRYLVIIV